MSERGFSEAEYEQVLSECPGVLRNKKSLLAQVRNRIEIKDYENLANSVYGSYALIFACRYQRCVLSTFALRGSEESLAAFAFNPELRKFEEEARKLHIKALAEFRKYLEENYVHEDAIRKERDILKMADDREGSGKYDLDLGPV